MGAGVAGAPDAAPSGVSDEPTEAGTISTANPRVSSTTPAKETARTVSERSQSFIRAAF